LYPNLYDHIRRALIPVMHDDSTSIMRSYLEETIAKSRKVPFDKSKKPQIANGSNSDAMSTQKLPANEANDSSNGARSKNISLELATEEELIAELARRKSAKFKRTEGMKKLASNKKGDEDMLPEDGTGQVCSLTGGDGMIPCRELME